MTAVALGSCEEDPSVFIPRTDPETSILNGTVGLKSMADSLISGRYSVDQGQELLGDEVAVLSRLGETSIFGRPDATYAILDAGRAGNRIAFEGYWRRGVNLETGHFRLTIAPDEGGTEIAAGNATSSEVVLRGHYGEGDAAPDREILLRRIAPLRGPPFTIIGHRGGGRNADFLPHAENSLELLRFAPRLGCNAVEIDVQLTSDDVPILFHDPDFSTRLIREEFLVGPVRDYSRRQIERFATLRNGEKVPTLEEALRELDRIDGIELVWVDIKTPEALRAATPIILAANMRNQGQRSGPQVVAGLPLRSVFDAYRGLGGNNRPPAICELSTDEVREIDAEIWAPRWTLGLQQNRLEQIQSEGRSAFVWTVDLPEFISQFVDAGYDGILSNYPTVVAWYHYVGRWR